MAEFESFARVPGFNPRAVVDTASRVRESTQRQLQQAQAFFNSNRIVDQQRIEDSRFVGQDLTALAPFAGSLAKYYEKLAKQEAKDIATGEQFAALFDPNFIVPEEAQTLLQGELQNSAIGEQANALEASGQEVAAEELRKSQNRIGAGVTNEKALLTDARSRYAADILELVNSDELQKLYKADPQGALELATKIWIRNNNLQYTTKANFVGLLGETIRNTNSYMAQNAVSERIKSEKTERLAENDRQAVNAVIGLTESNATNTFQTLSEAYYNDNNGIVTRGAANRRAAEQLLNAAALKGKDRLDIAAAALTKPDQANTSLADTYPTIYQGAVKAATQERERIKLQKRRDVMDNLGKSLLNVPFAERGPLIEGAIKELGSDVEGVIQLRSQFENLEATPETFAQEQKLIKDIAAGRTPTPEEIFQMQASGQITRRGAITALQDVNRRVGPAKEVKTAIRATAKQSFATELSNVTGIKIDPTTFNVLGLKREPNMILSPDKAKVITRSYLRDLDNHLRDVLYSLNYGEMSQGQITETLRKAEQQFRKDQMLTPGGAYYFEGLFKNGVFPDANNPDRTKIEKSLQRFGTVVPAANAPAPGRNDYRTNWNPDSGFAPLRGKYKPGDLLYSEDETKDLDANFADKGVSPELARFASEANTTPLAILNDHLNQYRMPVMERMEPQKANKLGGKSQYSISNPKFIEDAPKFVPAFWAAGFSYRGGLVAAAAMYGNSVATKTDYFREKDFVNELVSTLTPQELEMLQKPNLSYRQLVRIFKGIPPEQLMNVTARIRTLTEKP